MAPAVVDGERKALFPAKPRHELGALHARGADLQMRIRRPADRPGGQERAAQIRGSAAGAATTRRGGPSSGASLASTTPVSFSACTARASSSMWIRNRVASLERPAAEGVDLARDAVALEEREGAPGHRGARNSRWTPMRPPPRRWTRPRPPRMSADSSASRQHGLARLDRGQLARERLQRATPSSSSRRRLYSRPSDPYEPSPSAADDPVARDEEREPVLRAERSARPAGRSDGPPARRARRT